MAQRVLTALAARLRFAATNLQWLPLITLLLLAATAGVQLMVIPSRQETLDAAEQRLAELERAARRAAIAREAQQDRRDSPAATRQRLLKRFPTPDQLNAELGRLIELARAEGLQLASGDYRLVPGKDGLFDRYQLNLPVKGSYLQIRRYLAAARRELPDLAVDDVSLRRENIGSTELDAQLRFVLFGRKDGS